MEQLALTVVDAARAIGIGRSSLYRLINNGQLSVVKIGRRTLITTESLRDLVSRSAN